ncbi:MAG: CPBP family intramembrane metalloprotease, partial [Clostridia bacterium]|nr:CPBP family intramembrane metalloprotease [Clostridia bacterium]
ILAAFIAYVLIDGLLLGLGQLLSLLPDTLAMKYLQEAILMIFPVAIVFFFGFSRAFKNGSFLRGLYCFLPFIVLQLFLLAVFFSDKLGNPEIPWKPWYLMVVGVVSVIGVGVREECIYRATIQNIVAKKHANSVKGIWITVIVGALIFGLTHVTNIFFGADPLAVLKQMVSVAIIGLLYGAVYLRSGSLWALILVHTLTDIVGLAPSTFLRGGSVTADISRLSFSWISIVLWLFYIGLAAYLLRPSKCKQIYENLCFAEKPSEQ